MLQLTYISSAANDVRDTQVREILERSRVNNAAADVTGLLLYDGRRFLQCLEGEASSVEAIYERIRVDPRHKAAVILNSTKIAQRAFGKWAMAAPLMTSGITGSVQKQVDCLTAEVLDANLRELFRSFARIRPKA